MITITIYEDRPDVLDKAMNLCEDYQQRLSLNDEGSEVKLINDSKGEIVTVSDDMILLLTEGIKYSILTDGAFDITIKPLGNLWNIGKEYEQVPSEDEIESVLELVNYNNIFIEGNRVQLKNPNMLIDLGAIAKGFIADQLKDLLVDEGITSGIINLGGNIHTIGSKPDGSNFEIGIQKPFGSNTESITSISVQDKCVVTAGVYQRYFKHNNIIYHHILDPSTGKPVDNGLWGVTIIADDAITADILSTVCFIQGLEIASEYIQSLDGVEAIFVTDELEVIEIK